MFSLLDFFAEVPRIKFYYISSSESCAGRGVLISH